MFADQDTCNLKLAGSNEDDILRRQQGSYCCHFTKNFEHLVCCCRSRDHGRADNDSQRRDLNLTSDFIMVTLECWLPYDCAAIPILLFIPTSNNESIRAG
jgi:hypothetical protein